MEAFISITASYLENPKKSSGIWSVNLCKQNQVNSQPRVSLASLYSLAFLPLDLRANNLLFAETFIIQYWRKSYELFFSIKFDGTRVWFSM